MDLNKLRAVFIGEADELLSRMEAALLRAEKNPSDPEVLRAVFQTVHTLKGNAATMGLSKMAELSHHVESALVPAREGRYSLTPEWIDFLLQTLDVLKALLEEFQANRDMGVRIEPAKERLAAMTQAAGGAGREQGGTLPRSWSSPAGMSAGKKEKPPPEEPAAGLDAPSSAVAVPEAPKDRGSKEGESVQRSTVRVQLKHLDNMMNLVGELTITKSRLLQGIQDLGIPALDTEMKFLERLSSQLQDEVLQTRMVPVDDIFQRYGRVVRDISRDLHKQINFVIQDNGIFVDRILLEKISEAVVHLLRNAIDHGIENPGARKSAGKLPIGTVSLVARHEKNYAVISVMDDGSGIDVERVKRKAVERGIVLADAAAKMSDQEAFYLICHPGLSTKEEATQYSGRGVGMDVVQEMIESVNGHLDIRSARGLGSQFALFLPLNLAILQALLLRVGDHVFAMPLNEVQEIVALEAVKPVILDRGEVIYLRDEVLPLVRLSDVLRIDSPRGAYALVIHSHKGKYALEVDALIGRQEIVLKNLSGFMRQIRGIGGATILGDGRAILILDAQGLI